MLTGRFQNPQNNSGWKYDVFERDRDSSIKPVATLEFNRVTIPFIPPNYQGSLRRGYEYFVAKQNEDALANPNPRWPVFFEATVWEAVEFPLGLEKKKMQDTLRAQLSQRIPLQDPVEE